MRIVRNPCMYWYATTKLIGGFHIGSSAWKYTLLSPRLAAVTAASSANHASSSKDPGASVFTTQT